MCVPQIAIGGRNKYMINGHTAQLQRVQNLFHSVQLNVNNPHFLIMQGRITKVLNMKPIEILGMIEEAAGTRMFETKKQNALKTIEKKETKLTEIDRVMKEEVTPRLEKLGKERSAYLEFTSLSAEIESSGRIVQAYEYVCAEQAKTKCAESQVADADAKVELTVRLAAADKEDSALKKKLSETIARKEKESAGKLKTCEEAEQEASKDLVKVSAEHTTLRKALEADVASATATEAEIKRMESAQTKAEAELAKSASKAAEAASAAEAAAASAAEKQTQYEAAMGLASSSGEGVKNLQGQLSDAGAQVAAMETQLKTSEMAKKHLCVPIQGPRLRKDKHTPSPLGGVAACCLLLAALPPVLAASSFSSLASLEWSRRIAASARPSPATRPSLAHRRGKELKEAEKKLADARKGGSKAEKETESLAAAVQALKSKMEAMGCDEAEEGRLSKAMQEKQKAASELGKKEREIAVSVGNVDFRYSDPEKNFDRSRVKGTVASNLSVVDAANNMALEALAGGRLHQVIVDDDKTGMLLLTKGKLQRRVTLIALNKVEPRTLPAAKLAAARNLVGAKKVHLALELLAYAPEVGPAMAHVFGETLVCDDKEAARAVCDALKLKTVTLEGDLFDPSGTLTGGSRARSTNSLLARLSLLAESRKELYALEAEVSSLRAQLDECRASAEKLSGLSSNLEVKVHQLSLHAEQLRSSPVGQLDESLTKLKGQLKEAEEAAEAAKGAKASAEARKAELTAQLKDMEGNRDDMMKRLKGAMDAGGKEAQKALKAQQKEQALLQKAAEGLAANESEASAADEKRAELGKRLEAQTASLEAKAAAEQAKRDAYDEAKAALTACEKALGAYDKEAAKIGAQREKIEKERQEGGEELTRIEHRAKGVAKEVAAHEGACKQLLKLHPWMATEQV